jgi:ArsR family transcriptional regulator, arsenate/arsenite/antimonite-responsive transcriptional repressor
MAAIAMASARDESTVAQACCTPLLREPLTADQAAGLARVLKALADPVRLRLVSMVAAHDGGEACVCELTEPLGLTQPTISHHLKILVEAGIFTRDKRGVWAYYALVPGVLDGVSAALSAPGGLWSLPRGVRQRECRAGGDGLARLAVE